jgi:hypothetical protein
MLWTLSPAGDSFDNAHTPVNNGVVYAPLATIAPKAQGYGRIITSDGTDIGWLRSFKNDSAEHDMRPVQRQL